MEQNYPAVSVIIPIYMVENYLRECLDSAVNQTLRDIEIICVDDGSPDHSAEIAAEYAKKYDNVKLIHKENGGQSSARNVALDIAIGRYIYFLDSDDYLEHNALEELYTRAVAEDLDMVFFNAVPFFENKNDKRENTSYIDFYKRKGNYSGVHTGQTMFAMMHKNHEFLGSPCFEIIRRSLIEENGLRFYNGIIHEDNLFTFQCIMLAQRVGHINKAYYHRRLHSDSTMTAKKSMRNVEGYLVSYSEMLTFMHNRPVEEAAFPQIFDYLYYSIFGNARRIFCSLDIPREEAILIHGDFCAAYFLDTLKRNGSADKERENLLIALNEIEQSMSYRVGRLITFIPRAIRRVIRSIRENGLKTTIRKIRSWVLEHIHAFDERAQKSAIYKKVSAVPRKLLRQIRQIRNRGIGCTCRIAVLKLFTRFSRSASPLVSIILPVYNVETYLAQCLDSLLNQTMKQIEIIAVDDGSTDSSLEILNRYAAKDDRVHVFTQKNQYAGAARNLGLSHAKGEYVIFLDSDDFFSKNLARDAYAAGKAANADIVLFGAKEYNNATGAFSDAGWYLCEYLAPKKQPFSYKDCPNHLYQITTPCPWTKMFRRHFVQDAGLQFQRIQNANDLYFTYSALAMAKRIVTLDKPLVNYRVGLTSNLQTTKSKHPLCFFDAYKAWHDKLAELGVLDGLRKSYVNQALSGCLFNLRTQSDPTVKQLIFNKLKTDAISALELIGYEESFYSANDDYKDLLLIINGCFDQYLTQR